MTHAYFGRANTDDGRNIRILIVEKNVGVIINEPFMIDGELVEIKDSDISWVEQMLETFGIDLVL